MRRQRPQRRKVRPNEGIYTMDGRMLRVRHNQRDSGWYAHEGTLTRGGALEWTYIGQTRLNGARLLPIDIDCPLTCTCGAPASGDHVIARQILCNGCMTDHLRKVS